MEKHHLSVNKTATYYTIGDVKRASKVWIVLHGYAQLARTFINRFEEIQSQELAIIAPEGLHRFYQKGFYGDVVASWMTKEDREVDISDYVEYLSKLTKILLTENQEITIFGFSQGVATTCRWVVESDIKPKNLILWAGTFPNDLNLKKSKNSFRDINCFLVFDKDDPFRNETSWNEQLNFIDSIGVKPKIFNFDGGHRVPKTALKEFYDCFMRVS